MKQALAALFILISVWGNAQINYSGAKAAADKIHKGVLVVRLYQKTNQVNYLRELGKEQQATALENEVQKQNEEIMKAFETEYTFGKLAFMYADQSMDLVNGNWDSLLFDSEGSYLELDSMSFLVADFSVSKMQSIHGLNIWDWDATSGEWVHPPTPFPSQVQQYTLLGLIERSHSEMIKIFNDNFQNSLQRDLQTLSYGTLIVRLKDKSHQINLLRASNKAEEAAQLEEETNALNQEIMNAFHSFYTYGSVYFMKPDDSQKLIDGNWEDILMNENGSVVSVAPMQYMIADFNRDNAQSLLGLNIQEWNPNTESWEHPASPFPSFTAAYSTFSREERSFAQMVNMFNNELLEKLEE